ncbi:caspase family protein [Enterobacter quasimori]|uniref:Caspase family protein n=1 Tax=Enterobacter quasimori TaxID=2838947 RepID=A0ABY0ANW4_9ENTR|nr:caspase family protein [Enterobacter quasimori]RTN21486.1 caspase family protein [Enterobacter quasimori]
MGVKALLVGIAKYANPAHNLNGVENDVAAFLRILNKFGISDVEILRDSNATSDNIRKGLYNLVSDTKDGDARIFYQSSHGYLLPSEMSSSNRDEALVPYEGTSSSLILDTWISQYLKTILPQTVSFWGIYDSCFSGSMYKDMVLDKDLITENVLEKELETNDIIFDSLPARLYSTGEQSLGLKNLILDDVIQNSFHFGAVQSDAKAAILNIDGLNRSVFTWALEQVLTPGMSISELEKLVTEKQKEKTPERIPQIACTDANKNRIIFSGI